MGKPLKKSVKPRRPDWITDNKVLLALHWLADDDGYLAASDVEIARAAGVRWNSVENSIQSLEYRGHLKEAQLLSLPWRVRLFDRRLSHQEAMLVCFPADEEDVYEPGPDPNPRPLPGPPAPVDVSSIPLIDQAGDAPGGQVQQEFAW